MKRTLFYAGLIAALALPLSLRAAAQTMQNPPESPHTWNHGEFAVYGDMFRYTPKNSTTANFLGLGARVGFNVHPNVALEAEMNYDFEKNYTTVSTNGTSGSGSSTTMTARVRPITGLFGPKFQFGTSGPFRAFVTGKAGFLQTSSSMVNPSGSTFTGSLSQFGDNGTHFAAYPGGGIEGFLGPVGLRLEAGDEIFLSSGVRNNLRVTFGPSIRF
jgi:opacity protein-like surface antigen